EFRQLDLLRLRQAMAQPVLIDGRNLFDPAEMARLGFRYQGIGRGSPPASPHHNSNGHKHDTSDATSEAGVAGDADAVASNGHGRRVRGSRRVEQA
ncbi:MAG TPA: hypothetical protein VF818_07095, partial [Ktedonobacterales bacterium]